MTTTTDDRQQRERDRCIAALEAVDGRDLAAEDRLKERQRRITIGELEKPRRAADLIDMFDAGYTQAALAEVLTQGALTGGGEPLTESAVQKVIRRNRGGE